MASVCPQPSNRTPKGGTQVLPVRATPGHLNHFATLVFQQHGQQSALRKRKGEVDFVITWFFLFLMVDCSKSARNEESS
jgi:hypothetical protein